jgi:hypothetical protein
VHESNGARCLSIVHDRLDANTPYLIRAKQGLPAADGTPLEVEVLSRFITVAAP